MGVQKRVLVAANEELSVRRLKRLLYGVSHLLVVVEEISTVRQMIFWLLQNRDAGRPDPELIFLDIELLDEQCCDAFRKMYLKSAIVFTTSYDECILKLFRENEIAYLLKPVHRDDLLKSLDTCLPQEEYWGNGVFEKMEKLLGDLHKRPETGRDI